MSLAFKLNHVTEGLELLLAQFKEKDNFEALLTSFLEQIQDIEDMMAELIDERTLDTAVGDVLDLFGKVVGQPREGRTDADYRVWIKARIQINRSSGTTEEIYNVLNLITGTAVTGNFEITEPNYPAYFKVTLGTALGSIDPNVLYDVITEMRSAAVAFNLVYVITDPAFKFDSGPGWDQGHLAGIL